MGAHLSSHMFVLKSLVTADLEHHLRNMHSILLQQYCVSRQLEFTFLWSLGEPSERVV